MSEPRADRAVKDFVDSHRINIIDSNKRAHRITKMHTRFFNFANDYNKFVNEPVTLETEILHTIEISQSELEKIALFEHEVFNNMRTQGHYNMFETLMEQKDRERYFRENYPAVKKAYEQYSLMLKLAESGEL